jgi:hypothetical protein
MPNFNVPGPRSGRPSFAGIIGKMRSRFAGKGAASAQKQLPIILLARPNSQDEYFVFGVNYASPLGGGEKKDELKNFVAENAATNSAIIYSKAQDGRTVSLLAAARLNSKKKATYYAGSAAIAQRKELKNSERTIVIQAGSTYIAFQTTANSLPREGSEFIGSSDELFEFLADWKTDHGITLLSYLVENQDVKAKIAALGVTSRAEDLLNFQPQMATVLSPPTRSYIIPVSVAILALAAGYMAIGKGRQYFASVGAQERAEAEKRNKIAAFNDQLNATLQASWSGSPKSMYSNVIVPLMGEINLERAGWRLTKVHCQFETKTCASEWARVTGDYISFGAAANPKNMIVDEDYKILKHLEPAAFDASKSPFPNFAALPGRKANLVDLGDLFATLSLAKLKTTGPLKAPRPVVAWAGGGDQPPAPLMGDFVIEGRISQINAIQALPENTTLKDLVILATADKTLSFNLGAYYYVFKD